LKSPRRSPYATVTALLLALTLLAGLIFLAFPVFQLPRPVFIPNIGQKVRQVIAAGVIGLLLLALIGFFLRRHLGNRLARRPESRGAEVQPEAMAVAYRRTLMAQLGQLKVMDVARPFDLETSYVPLRVREGPHSYLEGNEGAAVRLSPSALREGSEPALSAAKGQALRDSPRLPLRLRSEPALSAAKGQGSGQAGQALLRTGAHKAPALGGETTSPEEALVRFRHLALLGEPGAGKTTLLRHLAFQAAQGKLENLPDFPILISLSHLAAAAPQSSLPDLIIKEIDALYDSPSLRFYLEERLEEGSVLLLLDGLDEISGSRPQETEAAYRRMVGQINVLTARYPRIPVVVTSRQAGWKGLLAASFHTLEVAKLAQDDIGRFIENWFGRGSNRALELRRTVLQSPQVRALAANPLLLSLMALVFEQDEKLPEGRAELYRRGLELLLEKWETHRGRKRVSRFTGEHQRDLLGEVALHFHLRRLLYFPEDDLSGITASYLSAVGLPTDWVPTVLERISAQHGLLRQQAIRWYSFPHLTWQEYFAAAGISKRGQLELVLEGIPDPWWKGTALFLAGMLEDATPLLKGMLDQEDDVFRSNLLLAGRCLAGHPRIKRAELRESIIEWLQELVEGEVHLPLRRWAIGVLTEIGDPSINAYFLSLVTARKIDQAVHRWVTAALVALGDESTVANLAALLPDQGTDLAVRTNLAAALSSLGDQSVVPQFLALLPDEGVDYRVRMAVAEALGALGACLEHSRRGGQGDESVIPQLLRLLPNEKIDYRVRVRVADALGVLGACTERKDESITPQLLRLLSNEKVDYNVRMSVAETLGSLGDNTIASRLLAILDKRKIDPDVRASIAAALGFLGDQSVVPQLLRLLSNEKIDPSIRWRIVDALGALGAMDSEATVPDFLDLLANERIDASVRVTMAEAMGEKTVTPRLPAPIPVGKEAAEALRSLGDRSRVLKLLALLSDRGLDRSVRLRIVEALGALGDDRITAEGLAALLDDEEIGSDVYQALFLVSQRIGMRVFPREGGGYEIR
jgi:HEAT repeat protein